MWSSEMGAQLIKVSSVGNVRLRNQEGWFTLATSPFPSLEEYVERCESDEVALRRFLIPTREARYAVADLDAMGINHTRVYPDILGCAMAARMRMALQSYRLD